MPRAKKGPDSTTSAATASAPPSVRPSGSRSGTRRDHPFPQTPVPPKPLRTLHLPYERAVMLARLPRRKFSESSVAALTGMAGATAGAFNAIHKGFERIPFSLELYELVEVLVFFGFFVWLIVSLFYSLREKTSGEYLGELYPSEETAKSHKTSARLNA
jgi:hypothetical protein